MKTYSGNYIFQLKFMNLLNEDVWFKNLLKTVIILIHYLSLH